MTYSQAARERNIGMYDEEFGLSGSRVRSGEPDGGPLEDSATADTSRSLFIGMQLSELLKAFLQLIVCCVGPIASDVC